MFKRLATFLFALIFCSLCIHTGYAVENSNTTRTFAIVNWTDTCETYEQMVATADVIAYGTVVSQEQELRGNLVFTTSQFEVSSAIKGFSGTIDILQVGGTCNGFSTPAPLDAPLLTVDAQYTLYLTYSPADELYDGSYQIIGGSQGLFSGDIFTASISLQSNYIFSHENAKAIFNSRSDTLNPMANEYYGGHWHQSQIGYYIYGASSLPSGYLTNISNGITSWNDSAKNRSDWRFYETSSALSPDVMVYSDYYGTQLTWNGYTQFMVEGGNSYSNEFADGTYVGAWISLNLSKRTTTDPLWRGVACHEAGHVLGLDHTFDTGSVMIEDTDIRGNVVSPSNNDFGTLNVIWELHSSQCHTSY